MKKKVWRMVFILAILGCVASLGFAASYFYQDYQAQKAYEAMQKEFAKWQEKEERVTVEEIESKEFTGEWEGEEAALPDDIFLDMENPINFDELIAINPDIYAWIRIPNTRIDYPIAQRAGEDGYYLKHDMYGEPRFAGCIYTEDCNSKDFTDKNTVIYGHNMKNGTMFKGLHSFSDATFFAENPYVYIYTPTHVLAYKIFAAYVYDDRHIMNSFDFSKEEVYAKYLDDIINVRSMEKNLREDVAVSTLDTIITLETCIGGRTESRYVVQAVRIKDEVRE